MSGPARRSTIGRLTGRAKRSVAGGSPVADAPGGAGDRASHTPDLEGIIGGPTLVHDPALDADPRLVVLMPHLDVGRMSGGPNTILQLTVRLAMAGVPVRYVAAFGPLAPDEAAVREHIGLVTGHRPDASTDLVDASGAGAEARIGRRDVLLATWWPTAHVAQAALALTDAGEFLYLIQDFEPGFYPWSTRYALAESTYRMPMRAVVNQPFVLDHIRRYAWPPGERPAAVFMPAVDRGRFRRRPRGAGTPRRLVFYARPRHARNLYEVGIAVLRSAAAAGVFDGEPWEFAAIGEPTPDVRLSDRHVLTSTPWMSYDEYATFLGESDVLLSLMLSPHTSYPPLEMASAGGSVVTNTFGAKTCEALASISPLIHGAPPDVAALADALATAVGGLGSSVAAPPPALPGTWDDALREVVDLVRGSIAEIRRS